VLGTTPLELIRRYCISSINDIRHATRTLQNSVSSYAYSWDVSPPGNDRNLIRLLKVGQFPWGELPALFFFVPML
jgi:hypothetical protein